MADFLETMVDGSRARAARLDRRELQRAIADAPPPAPWPREGFVLVAEIKPISPADGPLERTRRPDRAEAYVRGGARAISVLTEPSRFGGSLAALAEAARRVAVPVLRKDFVLDPLQIDEARAAGASAVLLLARLLSRERLAELAAHAHAHGMAAVVEIFSAEERERVPEGAIVAVNARDLATMGLDPSRFETLRGELAASGLADARDIERVVRCGYTGALVGSALMRAEDPEELVARLVAAGRSVCT